MSQREILFKAKRTDNGEWVEGVPTYPEHEIGKCYMITRVHGMDERFGYGNSGNVLLIHDAYEVDQQTVCQYTGLNDKNGKKIFEGDILKYKDDYTKETKCEVHFHRFGFMAVWPNDWDAESLDNGFHVYSEVIGNIHDN